MSTRGGVILFVTLASLVVCDGKAVQENTAIEKTDVVSQDSREPARKDMELDRSNGGGDILDKDVLGVDKKSCDGKHNLWLIAALSKIAKVVSTDESRSGCGDGRSFRVPGKSVGTLSSRDDRRDFVQRAPPSSSLEDSTIRVKRKYHCHAIRDIHVPGVIEKMPAYSCKLKNRTFVLSSPRFLQDRRSHLDVDIDESIDEQLKTVPNVPSNNTQLSVVQARLVLKLGEENYGLRGERDTSNKRQANGS